MEKRTRSLTVTQHHYIIRSTGEEELSPSGLPHHYTEFDGAGHPVKEISYNRSGDFEEMFEYEYDGQGHLIRESYYPAEEEIAEEKTFERNGEGAIVKEVKNYRDGSVDTITYEYDGSEQLVRRVTTNDEGGIDQVETFGWEEGKIVSHLIVDGEGTPVGEPDFSAISKTQTRVEHDEQGRVVLEEETDDDGEAVMTISRSYHGDGRPDRVEVWFNGQGQAINRHYFLQYEYSFWE